MSVLSKPVDVVELRPEVKLLLCCARTHMDAAHSRQINVLLREKIDWNYVLHLASRHRTMPLLYWNLRLVDSPAIPEAVLAQLKVEFQATAQHNLFLSKELLDLITLFEGQGIVVVPYKGPVLATTVYGNPALREFGDLDILVREQDIIRAKHVLIAQGYRPRFQLDSAQEATHFQSQHAYNFIHATKGIVVELHWRITQAYFDSVLEMPDLWQRLVRAPLINTRVTCFRPEDLLLILCIHAAKHCWGRLFWICDIAELLRAYPEMNWDDVLAKQDKHAHVLLLGLCLIQEVLNVALPPPVQLRLQETPQIRSLAAWVENHLFRDGNRPLGFWERLIFHLRMQPGWRQQVQYCVGLTMKLTPTDQTLVPLPVFLSFVNYVLRPLRLLGKYGLVPLKHFFKIKPGW
jgi:hypothetical protein